MRAFPPLGLQAAVGGTVLEEEPWCGVHTVAVAAEVPANALADDTSDHHHELLR